MRCCADRRGQRSMRWRARPAGSATRCAASSGTLKKKLGPHRRAGERMKSPTADASARQHSGEPLPVLSRGGERNSRVRNPGSAEVEDEIAGVVDQSTQELQELSGPLAGSSAATVVVFVPLAFLSGRHPWLFRTAVADRGVEPDLLFLDHVARRAARQPSGSSPERRRSARRSRRCRIAEAGSLRLRLASRTGQLPRKSGSQQTPRWREMDSNLYGAFPVKWSFFGLLPVLCSERESRSSSRRLRSGSRSAQKASRSALTPDHAER